MKRRLYFLVIFFLFSNTSCRRDINGTESSLKDRLPKEETVYVFPFQTQVDTDSLSCGYKTQEHWSDKVKKYVKGEFKGNDVSLKRQKEIGNEIRNKYITFPISHSRKQKRRVQIIIRKMKPHLRNKELNYTSYIVESPKFNAFTIPGGNIYVTTGLLEKVKSDDVLAYIIGHELGHNENGHTKEGARFYEYVNQKMKNVEEEESTWKKIAQGLGVLIKIVGLKVGADYFNQSDELEADIAGLYLAHKAGYDPERALEGFELLKTIDIPKPDKNWKALVLSFFRTHPWSEDRLACGTDYVNNAKVVVKCDSIYAERTRVRIQMGEEELLPVFKYPHSGSKQLKSVKNGRRVEIICDCVEQPNPHEKWIYIQSGRGAKGWVRQQFLEMK